MKTALLTAAVSLGILTALPAAARDESRSQVMRGQALATAGDCVSCHTTAKGQPFAGGRGIETPFGVIYTPNITPDRETGIGRWTNDDFWRAMHDGRGLGGRHLYPAFPYPYYSKISRQDADDIKAFLDSLEPVHAEAKPNELPFPLNMRAALIGWNMLFFDQSPFKPDSSKSEEWNRGAYLVDGLGHCAACHTAKNMLGGDKSASLQGGVLQSWFAPNLNGDTRTGLGSWSTEEIVEYLKTGRNEKSAASGPMAEVVQYSTSKMADPDLKAMAVYLKSLPAASKSEAISLSADDSRMKAGQAAYVDACAACHTTAGTGIANLFPTLKGSAVVQSADPTTLIRVVLQGTRAVATDAAPTAPAMPGYGWRMDDAQVAAVVTYIRNGWGNAAPAVSPGDVKKLRGELAKSLE